MVYVLCPRGCVDVCVCIYARDGVLGWSVLHAAGGLNKLDRNKPQYGYNAITSLIMSLPNYVILFIWVD